LQLIILLFLSWLIQPAVTPVSSFQDDGNSESGRQIALSFTNNHGFIPTEQQLATARDIGIQLLEISDPAEIGNQPIDGFFIFAGSGIRFPTVHNLRNQNEEIIQQAEEQFREISGQHPGRIAAFSLFYYPADHRSTFIEAASAIADSLATLINPPLYYQSARSYPGPMPNSVDFISARIQGSENSELPSLPVLYFEPHESARQSLIVLEQILNQSFDESDRVVIIPADWFFERIEHMPDLAIIFGNYLAGEEITFPLPEDRETLPPMNWAVLILLVIWGSFVLHFKYQPMFFGMVMRYFFHHKFFVADIIENRIRNISSGITLLIQHVFITGLFFYSFAEILMSTTGISALTHHYPGIIIQNFEAASFFVIGLLIALFSHAASIFWIYFLTKSVRHIGQVINLYSWPLILNLFLVTIMVFLANLNAAIAWALITAILFLLVWFFSFNIAAINTAKYLEKYRVLTILLTVGLHVVMLTSVVILALFTPDIFEPIELAITLP
jgi:hypothetical protein